MTPINAIDASSRSREPWAIPVTKAKRFVDSAMTIILLLLMAYALVGELAHEILGCAMLSLMLAHMALNFSWYRSLGRGRYSAYRAAQTVLDFLILGSMIVSMVSGIRLSRHVFEALGLSYSLSVSRAAHLLASHWGFCLVSIHLGMHWKAITASLRKNNATALPRQPIWIRVLIFGAVWAAALYGLWAFISRGFWRYLALMTRFAFFDFEEPLALFLLDYAAIMALFLSMGFLLAQTSQRIGQTRSRDLPVSSQHE